MLKIEDVKYLAKVQAVLPDANKYIRFVTTYLSSISDEEIMTSDGVVLLPSRYVGVRLVHDDKIFVLARCLQKGRFEGRVTKVTALGALRFKQLCWSKQHLEQVAKCMIIFESDDITQMGNTGQYCNGQMCRKLDLYESHVPLKQSACIELIDNMPQVTGKFNFARQTSFNKIQRAACEYCSSNDIGRQHIPLIARLIAYEQKHYFQALKQLPVPLRENFIVNQGDINIQLMDSLYHYFIIQKNKQGHPHRFMGPSAITLPPLIDINQIQQEHLRELANMGFKLARRGKIALVIMAAGDSEQKLSSSKALRRLPLPGEPTVLELLMRRYSGYIGGGDEVSTQSTLKISSKGSPVVIICTEVTCESIQEIFARNNYFGFGKSYVRITIEDRTVPLVDLQGKLCISAQGRTIHKSAGTAMAISKVLQPSIKKFFSGCFTDYVHFMGCDNIAQLPCDPVMLGLMSKFNRQISGKCVNGQGESQTNPRYVATSSSFHLLQMKELKMIGGSDLIRQAPVALNSLMFRLDSLIQFQDNFQTNLYIAQRFHMQEQVVTYYDYYQHAVTDGKVLSFEQDLRDYISASTQAILVKYRSSNYRLLPGLNRPPMPPNYYHQPRLY